MARIAIGRIFLIASVIMLGPLAVLPFFPGEAEHAWAFLSASFALAALGAALSFIKGRPISGLAVDERDGAIIVTVSWLVVTAASAWPFMAIQRMDFSRAFFESMSGWTTTGLSVVDPESAPRIILLYRSLLQLAGGVGMAIIMMALLPINAGAGLYRAEGRNYQLVPNVSRSARMAVRLYLGYALAGILALKAAGMGLFDAVNHSFCAVSTGGFSTKSASIGHWDSVAVEAVVMCLMVLGNLNFLSAYVLFSGRVKSFFRNAETRLMFAVGVAFIALVYALVTSRLPMPASKAVRMAAFEVVSALTTTGYSTTSYAGWGGAGIVLVIILMFIGGGMCSTAGGLKQHRVYLMLKAIGWYVGRSLLPRGAKAVRHVWIGDSRSVVDDRAIADVVAFVAVYVLAFALGAGALAACGFGLRDAAFEFASALGTVGLSTGATGASSPTLALWTMSAGMFLGRLEFFVVFVAVARIAGSLRRRMGLRPARLWRKAWVSGEEGARQVP